MGRCNNASVRLVIGCTGPNAAGKGEVLKCLSAHGFACVSLSDEIRDEARRRGIAESRETMIALGNELRRRYGPAILARRAVRRIRAMKAPCVAVDSVRAVAEVQALRDGFGDRFVLVGVTAPARRRFAFLRARKRPGDPRTLAEMLRLEARERGTASFQQQLDRVWELRDATIVNRGTLEELRERVARLVSALLRRRPVAVSPSGSRPSSTERNPA